MIQTETFAWFKSTQVWNVMYTCSQLHLLCPWCRNNHYTNCPHWWCIDEVPKKSNSVLADVIDSFLSSVIIDNRSVVLNTQWCRIKSSASWHIFLRKRGLNIEVQWSEPRETCSLFVSLDQMLRSKASDYTAFEEQHTAHRSPWQKQALATGFAEMSVQTDEVFCSWETKKNRSRQLYHDKCSCDCLNMCRPAILHTVT